MSRSLVLAVVAITFGTSASHAQLPGLRRKLKDAGRQAVGGQSDQRQPQFDNTILQLTPQVVTRLIAGLDARSKARGARGLTAGQLRLRSSAAGEEARSLNEQHSDDRARWSDANEAAQSCFSDQFGSKLDQRHAAAMQQRMAGMSSAADQTKFMQQWAAVSQEIQQAMASNDTAAIRRAQAKANRLIGLDPHADTAAARAACPAPATPAWMRRADSLAAISDTLIVLARAAEDSARVVGAGAAGMTPAQFAMAAERAEAFVWLHRPGNVGGGYVFSHDEDEALTARLPDLKKYFG